MISHLNHPLCPIRIINHPHPIRKCGVARSIHVHHPGRPIGEGDLFPTICVVVFNLFIWKVVGLHPILVGYLGGLGGSIIIYHDPLLFIGISPLAIPVREGYRCRSIWRHLLMRSVLVCKDLTLCRRMLTIFHGAITTAASRFFRRVNGHTRSCHIRRHHGVGPFVKSRGRLGQKLVISSPVVSGVVGLPSTDLPISTMVFRAVQIAVSLVDNFRAQSIVRTT
mmetsp:Transcript_32718/g.69693  ORF Transcript_32718/g.69693 Transcript_32718/m.69693 type:complete len:223 (-) Transcript_32718:107-775(-)